MKRDLDKLFFHRTSERCQEDCFDCDLRDRYLRHPKKIEECDDDECFFCSIIACPFGNFLHFHHDGCPECSNIIHSSNPTPEM